MPFLGRHRDGEECRGQGSLSRLPAYSSLTMGLQGARDFLVRCSFSFYARLRANANLAGGSMLCRATRGPFRGN
jgi:hypothetical protein